MADPKINKYSIRVVTGSANPKLAEDVCREISKDMKVTPCTCGRFADGEIHIQLMEAVRGDDLFIIQPTCPPDVNSALQELILLSHTLKSSSASRITMIIPYYGYARQDRKVEARVPISAMVVAKQLLSVEPTRFMFLDLHCEQIQGFFGNTPADHLKCTPVFAAALRRKFSPVEIEKMVIVSPDAGGVTRARKLADALGVKSLATILKRRVQANQIESMQLVGDVADRICLIFDDIIDTAGTLCKAAEHLIQFGATEVHAAATHGVFSGSALEKITNSKLTGVWVTDTICQEANVLKCSKLNLISVAPMIAKTICAIHEEKSVSELQIWDNNTPADP